MSKVVNRFLDKCKIRSVGLYVAIAAGILVISLQFCNIK